MIVSKNDTRTFVLFPFRRTYYIRVQGNRISRYNRVFCVFFFYYFASRTYLRVDWNRSELLIFKKKKKMKILSVFGFRYNNVCSGRQFDVWRSARNRRKPPTIDIFNGPDGLGNRALLSYTFECFERRKHKENGREIACYPVYDRYRYPYERDNNRPMTHLRWRRVYKTIQFYAVWTWRRGENLHRKCVMRTILLLLFSVLSSSSSSLLSLILFLLLYFWTNRSPVV